MRHRITALFGIVLGLAALAAGAQQDFPSKPVRIVIPYTAGGPVDTVGRNLQTRLTEIWKQPVLIDNKPGASAMIGSDFVAKSPADGYTLLLGGVQTHAMNVATVKKMMYDPVRDFTPITQTTRANWMLVTHPSFPAKTPQEVVNLVRANPGKYTYGSSGVGGAAHLAMAMLSAELGLQMVHAPYKGTAQAVTDTVSGQVHMVMGDQSVLLPHVRAGRLNAIAMTGDSRSSLIPEIPTIAETLMKGFDVQAWQGVWGPPGMNRDLVRRINGAIVQALKSPEVTDRLRAVGSETVGSSVEQFEVFVRREIDRWTSAGRRAGIEPE